MVSVVSPSVSAVSSFFVLGRPRFAMPVVFALAAVLVFFVAAVALAVGAGFVTLALVLAFGLAVVDADAPFAVLVRLAGMSFASAASDGFLVLMYLICAT